jgi:O-antigen/teichoic acid export membrane protein
MNAQHIVYYLSSKVFAAVLNLLAVAVFARLSGPSGYGEYLVAFAWAYIVYGFSIQWLRFSFFARYRDEDASTQVATFTRSLVGLIGIIIGLGLLLCLTGLVAVHTVAAVVCLVIGLSVYDSAHEIGRTRLRAGAVASVVILRAVLVLGFGTLALTVFKSPTALALAVALAHLGAITPLLGEIRPHLHAPWSKGHAREFIDYGWPLVVSFGVTSLGQNVDRLMLAHWWGAASVGPYGAVNDLIKQCFVVVSEAIAGAYITTAKSDLREGNDAKAQDVLNHAFRAYTAVAAFGAAFIMRFEHPVIDTLLGPAFREPTEVLVPLFVLASVFMIFRSFYFGQVIFFGGSSKVELLASGAMVATAAVIGLMLVPSSGAQGAAIALTLGQIVSCAVYIAAGTRIYQMPVPWRDAAAICGLALAGYGATALVGQFITSPWLQVPVDVAILAAAFAEAAQRFNVLGLNSLPVKNMLKNFVRFPLKYGS